MTPTSTMTLADRSIIWAFAAGDKSERNHAITIHRVWIRVIGLDTPEQKFMGEVDNPCPDLLLRGRYREEVLKIALETLLTPELEVFTCVAMAKKAVATGRPFEDIRQILKVDGDKLREASPPLYRIISQ